MGELLYFKNCEERKKAEELLKKCWPEVSFVVMRLDMQNILEEERIHFGKWDIEFDKKRMIYDGAEIGITDMQWEILQLLMSDSELSFSIREIAYAMNIEVHEAQKYDTRTNGFCNCAKERRKILICGNNRLSDGEKAVDDTAFFMGRMMYAKNI